VEFVLSHPSLEKAKDGAPIFCGGRGVLTRLCRGLCFRKERVGVLSARGVLSPGIRCMEAEGAHGGTCPTGVSPVPKGEGSFDFAQDGHLANHDEAAVERKVVKLQMQRQPQVLRLVPARRDSLRMTAKFCCSG